MNALSTTNRAAVLELKLLSVADSKIIFYDLKSHKKPSLENID